MEALTYLILYAAGAMMILAGVFSIIIINTNKPLTKPHNKGLNKKHMPGTLQDYDDQLRAAALERVSELEKETERLKIEAEQYRAKIRELETQLLNKYQTTK